MGPAAAHALRQVSSRPTTAPTQAAVDAVTVSLQQLERALPGATARVLSEAMLQLSIADSAPLAKLQATGRSVFGGSGGGAGGGAAAGPGMAHSAAVRSSGSGLGGGVVGGGGGGTAAPLDPGVGIPGLKSGGGGGPDLGLLGNFLLARWREDAARAAAAAARSRAAL